ncbi:MAG TPA: polysaccharide deacetylase family protein [Chitinophagales bacterium]|nr:polysaccharide deacetylase family protein [Chitinophagales bacterium]
MQRLLNHLMLDALLFTKTPSLLTAVYRECVWKVNTTARNLYLTFDDGPIREITPFVLDELKKYNAKATFFCIGKNIKANPAIFERILAEGHSIGNHTYDHLNGWNTGDKEYFDNIDKCQQVLRDSLPASDIGHRTLFRPPYGKLKPSQYSLLKSQYSLIMWDVLSFDFDLTMAEQKVLDNVLKNAEAGSIIVMHDSLKAKPKVEFALPKILEHFTEKGFKFEKL